MICESCVSQPASPAKPQHQPQVHHQQSQQVQPEIEKITREVSSMSPTRATAHQQDFGTTDRVGILKKDYDPNECAGCGELLKEGQALIALDRQWHIWCFRCKSCSAVLNGEYMGKDSIPYCEKCYQQEMV